MGKYTEEAGNYSGKMSAITDQLNDVVTSLDSVNKLLGISSADSSRDMLTYNVIISKEEIKNELTGIIFDVGSYSSTVKALAKTIDDRIAAEEAAKLAENKDDDTSSEGGDEAA